MHLKRERERTKKRELELGYLISKGALIFGQILNSRSALVIGGGSILYNIKYEIGQ